MNAPAYAITDAHGGWLQLDATRIGYADPMADGEVRVTWTGTRELAATWDHPFTAAEFIVGFYGKDHHLLDRRFTVVCL